MKAKEIFLLILIILAGVIFYYAHTEKIHLNFGWEEGDFLVAGEEYTYEESQAVEPPFPASLRLVNAHGDVEIQGTDEERITITLQKRIWRREEAQAKEVSDKLHITLSKGELVLAVSTNRNDFKRRNFETNFRLSVPKRMAVELENSYGTVNIGQVKTCAVVNSHGKTIISDIAGDAAVENRYEDVEVENIQGNCRVESGHAEVVVNGVSGTLKVDHSYGNIRLENIGQNVEVLSSHSELLGRHLPGTIDCQGSYEKVTLIDIGPARVQGHHWDTEIYGAKGDLYIKDSYAQVRVSDIEGNLTIEGKNVEIFGKQVIGKEIVLSSSYENIDLAEFSGKTTISLSHGGLILKPLALAQSIEVKNVYSDITLYWPGEGKYPFEAQVRGGDIDWNMREQLDHRQENGQTVVKAFSGEKEKPSIFLSTSYGDIRVEQ
jgi:hypothetical protein